MASGVDTGQGNVGTFPYNHSLQQTMPSVTVLADASTAPAALAAEANVILENEKRILWLRRAFYRGSILT